MNRVIAYVDGFNLYFGLRSKGWKRYFWLDLTTLMGRLCKPDQQLMLTRYFTARIRSSGRNSSDVSRQTTYLDALATLPDLRIHEGKYLIKDARCRSCGASWKTYEEKMSDVNLAVALLTDAFDDRFDTALVVSGDSDLKTPVEAVRARFPEKRVVVVFPPERRSFELQRAAHAWFTVGEGHLRASQLPDTVTSTTGVPLHRPASWR